MTRAKLLIVADDLTGGLDTGIKFSDQGINVRVVVSPAAAPGWAETDADVLVAVTDSRAMAPGRAAKAVFDAVTSARKAGIGYIYKKTDSALRGNIGSELSAALAASGERMLAFLPSYPAMGRITSGGRHYISGVPVSESVFARDPFDPVDESDVCRLIQRQTAMPVWNTDCEGLTVKDGICVVDAKDDLELEAAGRKLASLGALNVTAGCAGFAAFLPKLLGLKAGKRPQMPEWGRGLLVVCGSVNPITEKQLDCAQARGFARVRPEEALSRPADDWLIIDANARAGAWDASRAAAATDEERRAVASGLAAALSELEPSWDGPVLITGGDTLISCLERLRCAGLELIEEIYPGVVLSVAHLHGRDRLIISKSGGFGGETLLCDLRERIMASADRA